jgi:Arc/MetJ-type ribon-helix-helix transcriptional regulator
MEVQMGVVQVQLPDDLKQLIDRQVAEGHAASEADFLTQAARLYADHLDAENEIGVMVERADADLAAGRYTMVATPEDGDALHHAAMARLRARLAGDATGH